MGLLSYLKNTKSEMKHVSWPTRKQAISYALIVVLISVLISAYLGVFDALFAYLIEKFVLSL